MTVTRFPEAMLDTQHIGDKHPIRRTHWEIHPVTQLEVCTTTKSQCDAGTGWTPLEDMPWSRRTNYRDF
ncbi:MAG: hypothetical protein IPK98_15445 [Chloracidobacterium sp.]|nr:hypothetical protein [Chloracidobacterium sp.]